MKIHEDKFASEEIFKKLFEGNPLPIWVFDFQSLRFLLVNQAAIKKYGYSKEEFLSMTTADIRPEDEKPKFLEYYKTINIKDLLSASQGIWKHKKKNGEIIFVEVTSSAIVFEGKNAIAVILSDVTEKEKAKQELIASEKRYKNLFENNLAAVFRTEIGGDIMEYNQALVDVFGYKSIDELKKVKAHDMYYSTDDRDRYIKDLKIHGFLRNYQMRMKAKDGKEIWILENVMLVKDSKTNKKYIEGTLIDITETKRIQQALQEREENYKSLIEHTPDGILIHDDKGEVLYANPAALKMMNIYSLEEITDKNLFNYVLPEYHEKIRIRKVEMDAGKEMPFTAIKIRRKDGKIIEAETKTSRITYLGKQSVEVVLHDSSLQHQLEREHMRFQLEEETNRELKREIASHIRTRQRLNANQKYIRLILDSSIDMICACDKNGFITEFNHAAQTTFAYSVSEIMNKDFSILYADQNQYLTISKTIAGDQNFVGEIIHIKNNGEKFPAYVSVSILKNEKGEIIGMMSISRDITRIKEAEDQLKKSVHEKEILLKEIHHRVKNNLQVISSILKLQGAYVQDKKTLELLDECRNRIASMAFIHATLYMTKDFTNINFAEYAGNLARNLQQSYAGTDKKFLLRLDIPQFFLHIDDAIPCGLIINELLSNSFKYAFEKKKKGTVGISVKVEKENIILAVWDDGIGFPTSVDYKNTKSLGLQLVISLAEQIGGTIKMESKKDKGTKFIISFNKSK